MSVPVLSSHAISLLSGFLLHLNLPPPRAPHMQQQWALDQDIGNARDQHRGRSHNQENQCTGQFGHNAKFNDVLQGKAYNRHMDSVERVRGIADPIDAS